MSTVRLPLPSDPTVSFSVSFAVGSQNDPPGTAGLCYLTGQMLMDASTQTHSYDEILALLYPLATGYWVNVDRERTTLTGRVHRDKLDQYLPLFSAAYLEPAFREDDFERLKSDAINYLQNTLRYSSDEELGKAALQAAIFAGTPYAHPEEGTLAGMRAIEVDDVRAFFGQHFNRNNVLLGMGGGYSETCVTAFERSAAELPSGHPGSPPPIDIAGLHGRRVTLIDKPGADASISFGFPLDVHRGEREFYALWLANSWLGEHRNGASHLFQVIRETRGLNYGNYSYIESFPEGGERQMPPVNVPRRHQLFEVWLRTLPNHQAVFALRAALRELSLLIERGLSAEQFELTRAFLSKYSLHYADTTSARLGYAIDDRFYGIGGDGQLARFRQTMRELTRDEVNAAIRNHLQTADLEIAIVTGDAAGLAAQLRSGAPTPIEYGNDMPAEVVEEDREIAAFPLLIADEAMTFIPLDDVFAG
jgi:zinc protease